MKRTKSESYMRPLVWVLQICKEDYGTVGAREISHTVHFVGVPSYTSVWSALHISW